MVAIGQICMLLLDIAFWIIIVQVVLSWLIAFEVINTRNPQAAKFIRLVERITDPVFRPLRRFVPPVAGIDLTPLIIIFGIYILRGVVASVFFY